MNNIPWKSSLAALAIGLTVVQGGVPAALAAQPAAKAPAAVAVKNELAPHLLAAVNSIAVTPTAQGSQISATIRLYNGGTAKQRVPEHELRVVTADGVTYTLRPSADNKKALQPKEISELAYMVNVDANDIGKIKEVSFVSVDVYTYPKKETKLLTLPAAAVWYGATASASQQIKSAAWGETFTIPGFNSKLTYKPVEASIQEGSSGRAAVVTVLAENPGTGRENVPSFRLDVLSGNQTYEGRRTESDPVKLEAGEKKYIHFVIPIDNAVTFSKLIVVGTDSFLSDAGSQPVTLSTGKLWVDWSQASTSAVASAPYEYGQPIAFDPLTKVVDKSTQVSLVELHMHENPGEGYQTAIAKFKVTNTANEPVALPAFGAEMANAQGVTYRGVRQANAAAMVNPGLSYVVNYSFIIPQTEENGKFTVKLLDSQAAAPYATTIAALQTAVQADGSASGSFSLYPFDIKFNNVTVETTSDSYLNYTYTISLDLDLKQSDNVVVDDNYSQLHFEIVDNAGRVIAMKDASFAGTNKLVSGKQKLQVSNYSSDQFNYPFTLNIYEMITTPNGTAKRLLTTIR